MPVKHSTGEIINRAVTNASESCVFNSLLRCSEVGTDAILKYGSNTIVNRAG
ncbi:hypothetical protein M378DRAFT_174337 [Amanita muscaria Koide BX008]|uniref:Uncharacterized protein n=1 Tax=Amanita muscaria (strain Koide BX008) TaxID=946122 RepID=A0A0C2WCF7_AMAMK|nr:hypothetical protein M378DRAFT_174337 [Amanita muscaria Koide BX008]